jgi:hypothetical protein
VIASVQPFPRDGVLATNLNLTYSQLAKRVGKASGAAYSYVVTSVGTSVGMDGKIRFEQHGSAPNFQGGRLTLCTCKHQMRSSLDGSKWQDKWIAGFTSRCLYEGRHWLFFLTRVADGHESHADLWECLPSAVREAKCAQEHFLGDLFMPKRKQLVGESKFDPRNYHTPPRHDHHSNGCDNGWHNDIRYEHADRHDRPASLLVGDPAMTFLWQEPMVWFGGDHCRNFKKWESVTGFLEHLECRPS